VRVLVPTGTKCSLDCKNNHLTYRNYYAGMAELVDAPDLGFSALLGIVHSFQCVRVFR